MRRIGLAVVVAFLAVALLGEGQPTRKMPVVGVLNSGAGPRSPSVDTARQGLRDLGYVEGETIAFDVRFAGMKLETLPNLAADLVRRNVDVILVSGPCPCCVVFERWVTPEDAEMDLLRLPRLN